MPSQLSKPAAQTVIAHALAAQVAAATLAVTQLRPHPPQLVALVARLVSHPSSALPLHSPKPATHTLEHALPEQAGTALGRVAHAVPHAPQCVVLVRVSASQPLATLRSQSPKPVAHDATVHTLAAHAPVALGGAQPRLQAPQWAALVRVSTSQPLLASPSQSAKPARQVEPQAPPAQLAVELAGTGHARMHAPQCAGSVCVLVSQPLAASPSQLALGAVQAPTAHVPFMHRAVPLVMVHRASHAPQWATLDCGSTHAPAQHCCDEGHGRDGLHPATQTLPTQSVPEGQWASVTQSTHARVVVSQRRVDTPPSPLVAQPSSLRQPAAQVFDPATQY